MDKHSIDYSLYLVTDEFIHLSKLEALISDVIRSGVTALQIREKETPIRDFIARAKKIKKLLKGTGIPLIINDRIDVALACDADGVHVGQADMDFSDVRYILGPKALIGLSVSTVDQVVQAEKTDADYLGVGHVYTSSTKKKLYPELGCDGLKKIRSLSSKKIIGIGGINHENAHDAISTGIDGIAVVSAICNHPDPGYAAKNLRAIVDRAKLETVKR